ncbi:CD276 antigen homolog [Clarias gariepinus]
MKRAIWIFVLFWSIPPTAAGDVTVTCILTSDCILPCRSSYHDIIHWYKEGKNDPVHTFYDNADHLQYQDAEFKGRTSLFNDQISYGNISLLLRTINFKDEGRYKCYTATDSQNMEQFVSLKVQVPIKSVDLQLTSEGISCSTKDVYPKPQISWYQDGSKLDNIKVNPMEDEEHLFSGSSVFSQTVKENTTYTCSVSLGDESQSYTASLRKENVFFSLGRDPTLHCPVSQGNNENNTITLRFGESSTVLRERGSTGQLRGKKVNRSGDGTVTIHSLEDSGTYTCERVTARSKQLVITSVQIQSGEALLHFPSLMTTKYKNITIYEQGRCS